MPTYYEMLQIEPTASTAEIINAIDTRYNQTRKLVTHHDPNVVNQANQALQLLETIRSTLTDGDKRQVYDQAIGLTGMTGGLFDPSAIISQMPAAPMVAARAPVEQARPVQPVVVAQQAPGLWACPKCKTDNPPQAVHCFKCGTQLVQKCPECEGVSSLISTGMCGNCGFHFEVATKRRKLRDLIGPAQAEAQRLEAAYHSAALKKPGTSGCAIWIAVIALMGSFGGCVSGEGSGVGIGVIAGLLGAGIIVAIVVKYSRDRDKMDTEKENSRNHWDEKVKDLTRMINEYKTLELNKTGR